MMRDLTRKSTFKAVILAAGIGSRIKPLTDDCPKCLLKVGGVTILERMINNITDCGIDEFIFVLGYLDNQVETFIKSTFPGLSAKFIVNHRYANTNTGYSLMLAEPHCEGSGIMKFDADVVFDKQILRNLITCSFKNALCIDQNIQLGAEEVKVMVGSGNRVLRASKEVDLLDAAGESIGIEKISGQAARILFSELENMMSERANHQQYYERAYERLIERMTPFHALDITGLDWTEIDTKDDFDTANRLFGERKIPESTSLNMS